MLRGVALFDVENAIHYFKGHITMRQKLQQYQKALENQEPYKTPERVRFQAIPIILNYFLLNLLKFRAKFCKVLIPCIEQENTDYFAFLRDFKRDQTYLIVYAYKIASNVALRYKDSSNKIDYHLG